MNAVDNARPDRIALGVVTMTATALGLAFSDAMVKLLSADFSVWQVFTARAFVAVPLLAVLVMWGGGWRALIPRAAGWVVLRSLCLMAMWLCFYTALPLLNLAVAAAGYYTGPLFITLFSALLIGEAVGMKRWVAIAIGFAGVLVILRPGTDDFSAVALLPVLAAVFYALAAVITRAKCTEDSPLVLAFGLNVAFLVFGVVGSVGVLLWQPVDVDANAYRFMLADWSPMGLREWAIMAFLAVLIVAVTTGTATAYQCAPGAVIAAFDYTYLVFAALFSLVIFSAPLDLLTVTGMVMITGAGLLAIAPDRLLRRVRS
ncbi:MAG: DMT family transporter [Pseudomonadota bacterium]